MMEASPEMAVGSWKRFGFWLTVALIGQAVTLQLIDAGPSLHYQHYRLPGQLWAEGDAWLLLIVALQAILVLAGLRHHGRAILAWLAHAFRPWQIIAIALVFYLPVAPVSANPGAYIGEVAFAALLQTLNLLCLVFAVWAMPHGSMLRWAERADRMLGDDARDAAGRARLDRFAWSAAVWVILLSAVLAFFSYERHPHVTDEVAYLLHARFLANGTITLPAPPVPGAFGFYLMEFKGDQWYPATPPGWPALLAVGVRLGVPWLVNPFLNGVAVLLTYLMLQELYNRRLARIAVLLLCVSPWFIFMGMNFMTHTLTLVCALAAALFVQRARQSGRVPWAVLAGAMVGAGSIVRPLDGLIVALLLALWALGMGGARLPLKSLAGFGAAAALVGALVLPYNQALTGRATEFPLDAYVDEHFGPGRNGYGFGPNRGFGWPLDPNPGHSPLDGLINANLNSHSLNTELFGWGTGSLLLAALAVFTGNRSRSDYLMLAVLAVVFTAFFFYYYSGGPDFGARYWYLMIVPLVALSVRGMQALEQRLAIHQPPRLASAQVLTAVFICAAAAAVLYIPWRAVDKYHDFWGMRPDVRWLAKDFGFGRSLVLIRGNSHPDYASAAVYNPLDLRGDAPIYAWDRDAEVRGAVIRAYADRPVWFVDGPTLTGGGYRVAAGPMPAAQALAR
jgi:4-amino-4-deoxy-L-arabinose transferase-like glycosyltransferase